MADLTTIGQPGGGTLSEDGGPALSEVGSQSQHYAGGGWETFVDEAEYVPDLTWPSSIRTYHQMRSDSQIEALHLGTVNPVCEFRWGLDTNKADPKLVERAAADLGLPIMGEDDAAIGRSPNKINFDQYLQDVLLGPLYGHFHHEVVGEYEEGPDTPWRLMKLAPRHPRTLQQFKSNNVGDLVAIRQNIGGAEAPLTALPPPIPAWKLVTHVWRAEAGSHIGRSMLRSLYREWLVKDRTMRIAAINLERAGGVPVIEGPRGASDKQLRDLGELARQFKVAEGGGGAIPYGSKLTLAGGSVPDAISLLKYCDECMARVWSLMLVQLGMTSTGNRALGAEFAIYAARAQRALAKWIATGVNDLLDRYTEWNDPLAAYAPRLVFEQSKPDGMSVTDLVSLVSAGVLTVDPELESWLRSEYSLPKAPEPPDGGPDLGDLTPDEVTLVQNSRNPPALPGTTTGAPAKVPAVALDPTAQSPTLASAALSERGIERVHLGIRAKLTLPDRTLRRLPTDNEIRAAVDFKGMDTAHGEALTKLSDAFLREVIPAQARAIGQRIRNLPTVTRDAVAQLGAPVEGLGALREHLTDAAHSGASGAAREAHVQGVPVRHAQVPTRDVLTARIAAQAEAVASLNANGVTLAAQRKALSLATRTRTPDEVARGVEEHLAGMKHAWTIEQLKGAVSMAQNQGRIAVFEQATGLEPTYEASELLDDATCDPCAGVDGEIFETLDEMESAYGSGGYVDCDGGPNCRGTAVAIYPEQSPDSGSNEVGGEGGTYETPDGRTFSSEDGGAA